MLFRSTVLVTAGASAPEDLVQALIVDLVERFGGEVETHDVYHEQVEFGLPGTLKEQMRRRGIDPTGRRVLRKDAHEAMDAWLDRHGIAHRTVDLTVSAAK